MKVWLNRDEDMVITGHRHPFWTRYEAGFDRAGRILGLKVEIYSDGGWTADLSSPVLDRALFHLDNAYHIPELMFTGRVCRTNLPSNTAFRGFGGPQGMLVVEEAINRFAERQGLDPADVRRLNFYGDAPRDQAPYGQMVVADRSERIAEELLASSDYTARRAEIDAFNRAHTHVARGIGFQPVKFGISFTKSFLNQAGALVLVCTDGTVQLNHGGTEMGQGLYIKIAQVVAAAFQIDVDKVKVTATRTDKVPNASPTAASSGSDLNGMAALDACEKIKARLVTFGAELFGCEEAQVRFENNQVVAGDARMDWGDFIQKAYLNRVSLSSSGFYATPNIYYDHAKGQGHPFLYYANGAACSEVVLDTLTGEYRVLRTDILHDAGQSLNPDIDIGQIEGGFVQGMGWLTTEELVYSDNGRLLTTGPATYKIPAISDTPPDLRVNLLANSPNKEATVFRSKAVGEPPLMLGIAVWSALRDAVASLTDGCYCPPLDTPATPERMLNAVNAAKAWQAAQQEAV